MVSDGPKRKGRFIKKGSKVLEKVALSDFSFREISEEDILTHDNEDRTIIHTKYHDTETMDRRIKPPFRFDEDLRLDDQRRPILIPMDFTEDWERAKKMKKKFNRILDEDFDFDFDTSKAEAALHDEKKEDQDHTMSQSDAGNADENAAASSQTKGDPAFLRDESSADTENSEHAPDQAKSMDIVGEAIRNLNPEEDPVGDPQMHSPETAADSAGELPPSPVLIKRPDKPESATDPDPSNIDENEGFIPVSGQGTTAGAEPVDPEQRAADTYRQRQAKIETDEKPLSEIIEEAKAKGYQDGFRLGEDKAEQQLRQKTSDMFGKVGELIEEFQGLKHQILDNVQQNFYELCQAMAESLLKREFSIKPETFATVLRKAISEAVDQDQFKIKVHPSLYDKLASVDDQTITKCLERDEEIKPGDFKIESDLSVVEGDLRKLISDLLDQADLNLFEEEDQAG